LIKNANKKLIKILIAIALIVAITIGGCAIYLSDYYRADVNAIEAFSLNDGVIKTEISDKMIAFGNQSSKVGFIFYPGGKVEFTSYEPLMRELASRGVFCILLKMPFNLAVLDVNAADGVCELFPKVERWYIGGHSLGGSMAATHLANNVQKYDGLVLLGAYSTSDLTKSSIDVLSIYGSNDKVMNAEKYLEYKTNLPSDFTEIIIDGGCHAYFGMYGKQEGDGNPTITQKEQITITANYVVDLFEKGE